MRSCQSTMPHFTSRFTAAQISSPAIGAFPRPAFLRIRFALPMLVRPDRSRKYSSVRSAETFSATATLINWFNATPSDSATRFASSNSDVWRRSATLLLLMASSSDLAQYRTRRARADPKFTRRPGEMPHAESTQEIAGTVHRRCQYHFVRGIPQLGSPKEKHCYRLDHRSQRVEHLVDFFRSKPNH